MSGDSERMSAPRPVIETTRNAQEILIAVQDYDLDATLASGQAFRWRRSGLGWNGIIAQRLVHLVREPNGIRARVSDETSAGDWQWLIHYLQSTLDLEAVLRSFPQDAPLQASVQACRGLRLLRQDPWECLASFICSSTKQIVQIQQIVELLCTRFGEPLLPVESSSPRSDPIMPPRCAFPTAQTLANVTESDLRSCKMGFRAPYVLAAARAVASGQLDLHHLTTVSCAEARTILTDLPGVGDKIANCVLLFAYGFQEAFPVDVWVMKALRELYFPRRRPNPARLRRFVATYFGPNAGYAQQYLFHYMRTRTAISRRD